MASSVFNTIRSSVPCNTSPRAGVIPSLLLINYRSLSQIPVDCQQVDISLYESPGVKNCFRLRVPHPWVFKGAGFDFHLPCKSANCIDVEILSLATPRCVPLITQSKLTGVRAAWQHTLTHFDN